MKFGGSVKEEINEGMEIEKLSTKLKEDPHVSGAYIRSLVKQLSSSRTKEPPMNPKDQDCSVDGDDGTLLPQNKIKLREGFCETQQTQPLQHPQQHKKQVRRRLHTSRPYQERLLNMAEARREIVTALKFHRAAMRQASDQHQQEHDQQQSQPPQPLPNSYFEQEGKINSRRNPRIYPSSTANFSNCIENISHPSAFSHPPPLNAFSWSPSPISHFSADENLNFTLPSQTLGLNLNFQYFNNLDATLLHNNNLSLHQTASISSSSSSSSSSPSLSFATDQGGASVACDGIESCVPAGGVEIHGGLHVAVDDEEMAEIKSLGEQHQMEWNDTVNLVSSARWFKFLKSMEIREPEVKSEEDDGFHPFDEVMEFPDWLNANESCLPQHLDDCYSEEYFQDSALPCMVIGEIEGMDGEWLA